MLIDEVYVIACPKAELHFDEHKRANREKENKRAQLKVSSRGVSNRAGDRRELEENRQAQDSVREGLVQQCGLPEVGDSSEDAVELRACPEERTACGCGGPRRRTGNPRTRRPDRGGGLGLSAGGRAGPCGRSAAKPRRARVLHG